MRPIDADKIEKFIEDGLNCKDERKRFGHDAIEIMTEIHYAPTIAPPPNDPLTLEELREMNGEPVWLHTFSAVQKKTQVACWAILECCSSANAVFLRAGVNGRLTKWFCNYGERWLAYRRKPEEGASWVTCC